MSNNGLNLMARMAAEYGVDKDKLAKTLSTTIFATREGNDMVPPTPEEMMTLLVICDQYKLNPFTRQVYAFAKGGKVVPIVSVDGWLAIINRQADYDGLTVRFSDKEIEIGGIKMPEYCECSIRRKGMSQPIAIPEFARECFVPKSAVWAQFPRRMLRHKAIIQCARVAFGLAGIYDEDEGRNIVDAVEVAESPARVQTNVTRSVSAPQPKPVLAVSSRSEMDKLLESGVSMALAHGNWAMAEAWINDSFTGDDLAYAKAYIESAKARPGASASGACEAPQTVNDNLPPVSPLTLVNADF